MKKVIIFTIISLLLISTSVIAAPTLEEGNQMVEEVEAIDIPDFLNLETVIDEEAVKFVEFFYPKEKEVNSNASTVQFSGKALGDESIVMDLYVYDDEKEYFVPVMVEKIQINDEGNEVNIVEKLTYVVKDSGIFQFKTILEEEKTYHFRVITHLKDIIEENYVLNQNIQISDFEITYEISQFKKMLFYLKNQRQEKSMIKLFDFFDDKSEEEESLEEGWYKLNPLLPFELK